MERLVMDSIMKGQVPTASDILSEMAREDSISPFDKIDRSKIHFPDGTRISSAAMNESLDSIENSIAAAIDSLTDGFTELQALLEQSEVFVSQRTNANLIAGEARRMLAMTEHADTYRIARGISTSSVMDVDLANSDDVFVDVAAKKVTLAPTEIVYASFDARLSDVYQNSAVSRTGNIEIGTPAVISRAGYGNRHILEITSKDEHDDIAIVYDLSLSDASDDRYTHAREVSVVQIDTNTVYDMHAYVESTYDGQNWTLLGQSWGHDTISVNGPARMCTDIRVTLRKVRADMVVKSGSALRHGYVFDVGHIRVGIMSFEPIGTLITNPIEVASSGIASFVFDANIDKPEGTNVEVYVASDSDGSNPDTLSWNLIEAGVPKDLVVRSSYSRNLEGTAPIKYLEGVGGLYDMWLVDVITDPVLSMDSGINQARLRTSSASLGTISLVPSLIQDNDLSAITPIVGLGGRIDLSGSTVYRLEFSLWSDTVASTSFSLDVDDNSGVMITSNGADVTGAWKANQVSIGLVQGRNDIVVFVLCATPTSVYLTPPPRFLCALERPVVKDYTMIAEGFAACARAGDKLIVNFDPTDMNHQVTLLDEQGTRSSGRIRVKTVLATADPSVSPSLSDIFVIAGV